MIYTKMWPAHTNYGFCAACKATYLFSVALEDIWVLPLKLQNKKYNYFLNDYFFV